MEESGLDTVHSGAANLRTRFLLLRCVAPIGASAVEVQLPAVPLFMLLPCGRPYPWLPHRLALRPQPPCRPAAPLQLLHRSR
jgi:hypothetical protein